MILIEPYSDRWPEQFRELAARIRAVLGDRALRIDHVGSTAVPGLGGEAGRRRPGDGTRPRRCPAARRRGVRELKRGLARHLPDRGTYADVKDPACDLIAIAAEAWAVETRWKPGPTDA
jgi:GrpB-like predicted nucleotidyltransferase (UPF0157 family)